MGTVRHQSASLATQKVTVMEKREERSKTTPPPVLCSISCSCRASVERLKPSTRLISTPQLAEAHSSPASPTFLSSSQGPFQIALQTALQTFYCWFIKAPGDRQHFLHFDKEKSQLHQRYFNISTYQLQKQPYHCNEPPESRGIKMKGELKFMWASTKSSQNVCRVPTERKRN